MLKFVLGVRFLNRTKLTNMADTNSLYWQSTKEKVNEFGALYDNLQKCFQILILCTVIQGHYEQDEED